MAHLSYSHCYGDQGRIEDGHWAPDRDEIMDPCPPGLPKTFGMPLSTPNGRAFVTGTPQHGLLNLLRQLFTSPLNLP